MATLAIVHDQLRGPTGMGRVAERMAEVALEAGWSVTLVGSTIPSHLADACEVRRIPLFDQLPALPRHLAWCAWARRALRAIHVDVVHVHSPFLMADGRLMTCHHLAQPAAASGVREPGHGVTGALRRGQRAVTTLFDEYLYRRRPPKTQLSFVSEFLKSAFITRYGVPRGGWVLPPPAPEWRPVTLRQREIARRRLACDDGIVVGYLGGVDQRKGFEDAHGLCSEPDLIPILGGSGTEALRCGRGRGVGFVEPDDILEACDVVVAPALFDAAPVAVLQALARGIPVVVTASTGWAAAIVRHSAGVVWDRRSPLADAVRCASRFPRLGARQLIDEFGADGFRARLLAVYEGVAASPPMGGQE